MLYKATSTHITTHSFLYLVFLLLILIENASTIGDSLAPFTPPFKTSLTIEANSEIALNNAGDTHHIAKRMDLESCLGHFDVHRNTIIRTGESQAIGGKYLQGIELDTIDECQRLCCETDSCDVYVFEEKSAAYCYLFECGPPENFHCKFTRHANYTSAVLTTVKHTLTVTTPKPIPPTHTTASINNNNSNNISQQEWELSNLKVKPEKLTDYTGSSSLLLRTPPRPNQDNVISLRNNGKAPVALCGRFQFTCHSGECIAVYNACDGIPQCEDGSDEGPECSSSLLSSSKSNPPIDSVTVNLLDSPVQMQKTPPTPPPQTPPPPPRPPSAMAAHAVPITYQGDLIQEQTAQQELHSMQQQPKQQLQPHLPALPINNREDAAVWMNRKLVVDNNQQKQQQKNQQQQLSQQQNYQSPDMDMNSRIFNHKGGLQLSNVMNMNGGGNLLNTNSGFPNANQNYNPSIYDTQTLQRNGLYIPQEIIRNDGNIPASIFNMPVPQQQQQPQTIFTPQGHIMLPANINWGQQMPSNPVQITSVQQQQTNVPPPVAVPIQQLTQGPTYIVHNSQPKIQQAPQLNPSISSTNTVVPLLDNVLQHSEQVNSNATLTSPQMSQILNSHQIDNTITTQLRLNTSDKDGISHHEKGKSEDLKSPNDSNTARDVVPLSLDHSTTTKISSPAVLPSKPQQPPSPVHEQYKIIHQNLAMEFRDHDGLSERPGGAVLSLTLGVLLTAALAILIGCRMRTVGRRVRRLGGKTPYSHEADFLVNGMYL